jgi:hypothetical protein
MIREQSDHREAAGCDQAQKRGMVASFQGAVRMPTDRDQANHSRDVRHGGQPANGQIAPNA